MKLSKKVLRRIRETKAQDELCRFTVMNRIADRQARAVLSNTAVPAVAKPDVARRAVSEEEN